VGDVDRGIALAYHFRILNEEGADAGHIGFEILPLLAGRRTRITRVARSHRSSAATVTGLS
jgi:hypothetical protein